VKCCGTNQHFLIAIIATKTNAELMIVKKAYSEQTKRDLIKDIKDETSSHVKAVLVALCTDSAELDAQIIKKAIKGLGTSEHLLTEVLCTRKVDEIKAISAAYKNLFDKDMWSQVENDTSGDLQKIYKLLIVDDRKDPADSQIAKDVEVLHSAKKNELGLNEDMFIRMLAGTSRQYCEKLYHAYADKHNKSLDSVIESKMGGAAGKALAALVTPLDIVFSKLLLESMKGIGTDDTALIRLIVTNRERDLNGIANRFYKDSSDSTLSDWVEKECSGDYKKCLISIIDHTHSNR
jgi:hypothetical protein